MPVAAPRKPRPKKAVTFGERLRAMDQRRPAPKTHRQAKALNKSRSYEAMGQRAGDAGLPKEANPIPWTRTKWQRGWAKGKLGREQGKKL